MTSPSLAQNETSRKDLWSFFRKQPVSWFLLFAAALFGYSFYADTMQTNRSFSDTPHYLELSELPSFTEQSLNDWRTIGYPLFLKIVKACGSPDLALLPVWQFTISIIAVCVFFHGLRRIGVKPAWANLVAGAIFLNLYSLRFYDSVLTDSLGLSAVIASLGLLLALIPGEDGIAKGRILSYWIALGLSVMIGYHIRPAYQLLVPLVPVLGVLLLPVVTQRSAFWSRFWKLGPGLSALTCVPLLAFCCLRLFIVGAFGLVSFSGVAMSGTSAQLLTPEMIPKMPADLRPMARDFLQARDSSPISTRLGDKLWKSPIDENGKIDLKEFNLFYSPIIYNNLKGINDTNGILASALRSSDNDWVEADANLIRFNRFVVNERKEILPELTYQQSKKAARYAYGAFRSTPARIPVCCFLLAACLLALVRAGKMLMGVQKSNRLAPNSPRPSWRSVLREKFRWESLRGVYLGILLPAAYFGCNTLLILVLLQAPLDRTVSPGMVFWPMVPLSLAAWLWPKPTSHEAVAAQTNPQAKSASALKQAA